MPTTMKGNMNNVYEGSSNEKAKSPHIDKVFKDEKVQHDAQFREGINESQMQSLELTKLDSAQNPQSDSKQAGCKKKQSFLLIKEKDFPNLFENPIVKK